jgi:hypothetical protein
MTKPHIYLAKDLWFVEFMCAHHFGGSFKQACIRAKFIYNCNIMGRMSR